MAGREHPDVTRAAEDVMLGYYGPYKAAEKWNVAPSSVYRAVKRRCKDFFEAKEVGTDPAE